MWIKRLTLEDYRAIDRRHVVPVVPLGSIEQHGPHLPMGTDTYQVEEIAHGVEEKLGSTVLVTPTLWLGSSANHIGYGACLYSPPTEYVELLVSLAKSFLEAGFRHLFFLNGHGGNIGPMVTALSQIEHDYIATREDIQVAGASWWSFAEEAITRLRESPAGAAGHACEIETSVMLAAQNDLVRKDRFAQGGREHPRAPWSTYDFFGAAPVTRVEMMHLAEPQGVIGFPELASPEKGKEIIEASVAGLTRFLEDFTRW